MDELRMIPALAQALDEARRDEAGLPDVYALPLAQARPLYQRMRERWNRFDRAAFDIQWHHLPAPATGGQPPRQVPLVRIEPLRSAARGAGTIVYLHGGGWVFGSNHTHLGLMAQLAHATGCTVHGVDYALAPEQPFPQGLNDAGWAWRWLRAHAPAPGPWVLGGDSAGANLAMGLMLDLQHLGEPLPDAGLLFYGAYAPDFDTPSHQRVGDGRFGMTTTRMRTYWHQYLGDAPGQAQNARACPLRASAAQLKGLPPLWVTAAQLDPLHDDSARLAARLAEAGTAHRFKAYAGVHHGFMQMSWAVPELRGAFTDAADFLRAQGVLG